MRSPSLQVGDHTTGNTHDVSRYCAEVVVPRSGRRPHLVILQQIRIDEDAQRRSVTKRRHAVVGLCNQTPYFRLMGRISY